MLGSLKGLAKGIQTINEIIQECNTEMLVEVWVYKRVPLCFCRHFIFLGMGGNFTALRLCCLGGAETRYHTK
jgi:hypothetical protein